MARQLFGTDGIRGVAGEYPLDPRTVHAVGAALGSWAASHHPHPEVLIGMDTRESGPWMAEQVAGGLARSGVKARFAGLITTPGVAYLTRNQDFVAGIMISASHNPYQDNGLKVFDHSGYKLPDDQEHELEGQIFELLAGDLDPTPLRVTVDEGLDRDYINYLAGTVSEPFAGISMVLDCANGAATQLGPELFRRLGATVHVIGCSPDGKNINDNCGALHVDGLRQEVLKRGAAVGVAFDGDADRAMLVSHSGKVIDGDAVLLLTAGSLLEKGKLNDREGKPTVVATVMSNLGLERALKQKGIRLLRTAVGDKYVLEEMLKTGAPVGGEQSGHVIFTDYATTGDGMLTALRALEVVVESSRSLDELTSAFQSYPQLLVNVRVKEKRPLAEMTHVQKAIAACETEFGDAGRVVVRFSGTEPLARVMVEGPDTGRVEACAHRIANAIREELGAA